MFFLRSRGKGRSAKERSRSAHAAGILHVRARDGGARHPRPSGLKGTAGEHHSMYCAPQFIWHTMIGSSLTVVCDTMKQRSMAVCQVRMRLCMTHTLFEKVSVSKSQPRTLYQTSNPSKWVPDATQVHMLLSIVCCAFQQRHCCGVSGWFSKQSNLKIC